MILTPTANCENKEVFHSATYYFSPDGSSGWKYKGEYYSDKEFAEKFPVNPMIVRTNNHFKGSNPDGTRLWLS